MGLKGLFVPEMGEEGCLYWCILWSLLSYSDPNDSLNHDEIFHAVPASMSRVGGARRG